jgi:DNA end-binding protein Ku
MALRASWRGFLKVAEVTCAVALHAAASTSDRIVLHAVNRKTGHRLRRHFVDAASGEPVAHEDQVKGYEVAAGEFVVLEPEEVEAAIPEADKTLAIDRFIACAAVDSVYLDRPYFLTPGDAHAEEAYGLIRDAMRRQEVAALARTVLFRRVRTLLIRAHDAGLVATTLNFDYEVRSAADAFDAVPELRIKGEMLDLARHIIATKRGAFDPAGFEDRYEAALAELVKAKVEGRRIAPPPKAKAGKVVDLMEALRQSAGAGPAKKKAARAKTQQPKPKAPPRRKAG